jgi:hypothetical protein
MAVANIGSTATTISAEMSVNMLVKPSKMTVPDTVLDAPGGPFGRPRTVTYIAGS